MLVRIDITPAAARRDVVREVLADRRMVSGLVRDEAVQAPQAPEPSYLHSETDLVGRVELISADGTLGRIEDVLRELIGKRGQVLALSVEPSPAEPRQQVLLRFNRPTAVGEAAAPSLAENDEAAKPAETSETAKVREAPQAELDRGQLAELSQQVLFIVRVVPEPDDDQPDATDGPADATQDEASGTTADTDHEADQEAETGRTNVPADDREPAVDTGAEHSGEGGEPSRAAPSDDGTGANADKSDRVEARDR